MKVSEGKQRSAILTGGSSGIGLATAALMLEQGYVVASLDLNQPDKEDIHYINTDVGDSTSVSRAVAKASEVLGGIDVAVNSAGISLAGRVDANPDEEWELSLNVNVIGISRVCREALPHLRASDSAAITAVIIGGGMLLVLIDNSLNMIGVSQYRQGLFRGGIIVIAIALFVSKRGARQ
jgi:NAD(P)-dependent dehydrogenase (short-subunit alcohol dehydrogenase family)